MKKMIFTLAAVLCIGGQAMAQFRPTDKTGINMFETPKSDVYFDGVKVTIGGAFTQSFQALKHSNSNGLTGQNPRLVAGVDQNRLISLVPGFNLASANLMLKTLLSDGISLNMELYLASRHHNETWVKGGFIQFDKLTFLNWELINSIMDYTTIKIGQMEVNYGDAHFRRSDGGNSIYNPFIENYIMDEFATEVGAEIDFLYNGLVAVAGVTNGKLNSNIVAGTPFEGASNGKHRPAFLGKLGYDKQFTDDLRARLTGSVYYTAGSLGQTLFGGDRAGSHYFGVMEYLPPSASTFTSGRVNPGFGDKVTTLMGNLFVKYRGFEWFSTVERAQGRARDEITGERTANQLATDLVFRFGSNENFWVGARYNVLAATMPATRAVAAVATPVTTAVSALPPYDVTVDRMAISAGWFITNNVMAKLEYVNQNYDYANAPQSIFNGGNFNGFVMEAVIGF